MHKHLITLFATAFVISACEAPPTDDGSATGTGGAGGFNQGVDGRGYGDSQPGTPGDFEANVGDRVFFGYDSSSLSSQAQSTLRAQAEWLQQYPYVNVVLEGHCDERGTREYNLALGERRANAARNFLISQGVSSGRITVVSYGKERPAALGSSESAWAQNRRAVTTIAN